MRVNYAGGPLCSEATFKRLLLLANEIAFCDRPSVMFDNWGTVGVPTPLRFRTANGDPIQFRVYEPQARSLSNLYQSFVHRDLLDPNVRRIVLEGLRHDAVFAERHIASHALYGGHTGAQVVSSLLADRSLFDAELGDARGWGKAFEVESEQGRHDTLRHLLVDVSIDVTTGLLGSEELGLVPVTDDPYLARLLSLRARSDELQTAAPAAPLGFELVRAVIPDEMLNRLTIPEVLEFRSKTKDVHGAWNAEVERLSAMLDQEGISDLPAQANRLVATEIKPKMNAFRAELASARDALFGDIIKSTTDWKLPALAIALVHQTSLLGGAVSVLGGAMAGTVKATVDYLAKRKGVVRRHGVAYLVQLVDCVDRR